MIAAEFSPASKCRNLCARQHDFLSQDRTVVIGVAIPSIGQMRRDKKADFALGTPRDSTILWEPRPSQPDGRCKLLSVNVLSPACCAPFGGGAAEASVASRSAANPEGGAVRRAKSWSRAGHAVLVLGCR